MSEGSFADATLVIVGHGSTQNAESRAPVCQHVAELRRRRLFADVREAFVIQEPKIAPVMASISTPRVFIVPLFISEGYFTGQVIPRELGFEMQNSKSKTHKAPGGGEQTLHYCSPVGDHPSMTQVLLARAREVVERSPFPRAPQPQDTTLFIAGHGTGRNDGSRRAIERQVELIRQAGVHAAVQGVFIEENPRVSECYTLARTRNVVIVPFFISDGLHTREDIPLMLGEPERLVRQRLAAGQPTWRNPTERNGKLVWCASAIGSEPLMADVILERVREIEKL